MNDLPTPLYVAMDIGCIECGVDSVCVGVFATEDDAMMALAARVGGDDPEYWRDGGQARVQVFRWPAAATA